MKLIDGNKIAQSIIESLTKEVSKINGPKPTVAFIRVGEDPASVSYVRKKQKTAENIGIQSLLKILPDSISQEELIEEIEAFNDDSNVHGILIQAPLPDHISETTIFNTVKPEKDVDGFHPVNVGNLASGYHAITPCTPLGCSLLIKKIEKNLSGKHAVIVGRSNLNGKPMAQLLLKENCTVTIVHSKTKNIKAECSKADILVVAIGVPNFVKKDWVKEGSIVIDVGINKLENKIVGDVKFEEVKAKVKAITPVPGGVGPMTIACLLKNTLECFKARLI